VLVHNACAKLDPYRDGKGHHIPAKAAFDGDPLYNKRDALAISNAEMDRLGIDHDTVTGRQASKYSAFAKTGKPLTWAKMAEIETESLLEGRLPGSKLTPAMARATVQRAIDSLKAVGIKGASRIPWGG
jgi:hypothetical protein